MSKFIWEKEDDVGVTITQADSPVAELEAEIAKVEKQLRDAGVSEAEEAALVKEKLSENNE